MSAADDRCVALLKELLDASKKKPEKDGYRAYTGRANTMEALSGEWSRIDPDDDRWAAMNAVLCLDHADNGQPALPSIVAMHATLVEILDSLHHVSVDQIDEGDTSWTKMQKLAKLLDQLPAVFDRVGCEIAEAAS